MRYIALLICLVTLVAALPEPVPAPGTIITDKEKREPLPVDDMPVLDSLIERHEKEGRTVNLSPQNNPRDGMEKKR